MYEPSRHALLATSDSGANSANAVASGYQRLLLSPGMEFDSDKALSGRRIPGLPEFHW